jgi:hypothetical protein
MCKNYSEMGYCPYYERCQFAHGYHDLAYSPALMDWLARMESRQTRCKNFWKTGQCAYGLRCQFIHYEVSKETLSFLRIQSSVLETPEEQPVVNCRSRLLGGLYEDFTPLYQLLDE